MKEVEIIDVNTKTIYGRYVKLEHFEQLQALTKEFAEGIIDLTQNKLTYDEQGELSKQAQQYLDSLKESV